MSQLVSIAKDPCKFFMHEAEETLVEIQNFLNQLSQFKPFQEIIDSTNTVLSQYEYAINQEVRIAVALAAKPYKAVATVIKDGAEIGIDAMNILQGDIYQIFRYLIANVIEVEREAAKWLLFGLVFLMSGNIWNLSFMSQK